MMQTKDEQIKALLDALEPFARAYADQQQYMPESGLSDDDKVVVIQDNHETELMITDKELLQLGHFSNALQVYDIVIGYSPLRERAA